MESVVQNLNFMSIGSRKQCYVSEQKLRCNLAKLSINRLECLETYGASFSRRITSICWHPKHPYMYGVGSKFGDIVIGSIQRSVTDSSTKGWSLRQNATLEGGGAGAAITAMLFDEIQRNVFYTTSIDSKVSRHDLENSSNSLVFHDYQSYEEWFTGMDVDFNSQLLAAGDNKGIVRIFSLRDGKEAGMYKLHKSKIHHIHFNKWDPTKFVTSGLSSAGRNGEPCKIWDIRKLNLNEPLYTLLHNSGVNCARFSPVDGKRLLTSDQEDEIRIYEYPFIHEPKIIKHYHKQFQHITPVKAEWHPLADLIVIGKYPKDKNKENRKQLRTIEFFNPDSGALVAEIIPPLDNISSLNAFNPTGELLASTSNSKLLIWRPSSKMEEFGVGRPTISNKVEVSEDLRNQLRGRRATGTVRRAREYSPGSDDNDNKKDGKKRPRRAIAEAAKSKTTKFPTKKTKK